MSKQVSIDALTRALCPSIDAGILSKPISWPLWMPMGRRPFGTCLRGARTPGHHHSHKPAPWIPSAHLSGSNPASQEFTQQIRAYAADAKEKSGESQKGTKLKRRKKTADEEEEQVSEEKQRRMIHDLCFPTAPLDRTPWPRHVRTPVIYESLGRIREIEALKGDRIRWAVSYLIKRRGEKPNMKLYEAMAVANWDTTTGSAIELAGMYKELRTEKVKPSSRWYHDALRLLAIHPDYLLRNTLLQRMEEEGVELTDEGRTSVALGLLRDGQNEMALDYWTDMVNQGVEIPPWVAETFIFVFTIRGFLDEALDVLAQALESKLIDRTPRFRPVWTYLLDECSRNFHYAGTKRMWDEMVQTKELVPSDGVVINVLNTAARHADPALATSAIELLSARNVKLGPHHYEPLLESYVHAGNLTDAFRVLGIMRDAGLKPDRASTRSIYLELVKPGPGKVDRVPGAVARLKESGPNPPAAAVNAILEAAAKTRDIARTLDVYRAICEKCQGVAPNQQTFALLLDECGGSVHAAFVVQEMDRYSVRPTHGILDHLIRCFAVDGNLDVALKYLDELGRLAGDQPTGRWISQRTLTAVLRRCFKERHERMWTVLEEAKKRGMQVEEWTGEKKE